MVYNGTTDLSWSKKDPEQLGGRKVDKHSVDDELFIVILAQEWEFW